MTVAEFKTAFPAFSTEQADDIQRHLDAAVDEGLIDSARAGDRYARVLGLAVAHRITIEESEKASGIALAVHAVSFSGPAGSVTRSTMAVERGVLNDWATTKYGLRYLQEMRVIGMGAVGL